MAGSQPISIIVSLMILALVLSPTPPCDAARLNERGMQIIINSVRTKWKIICETVLTAG